MLKKKTKTVKAKTPKTQNLLAPLYWAVNLSTHKVVAFNSSLEVATTAAENAAVDSPGVMIVILKVVCGRKVPVGTPTAYEVCDV